VSRIQRLNISRSLCSPIVDDTRITTVATWFIHELPGEDGSGVFVAIHNELDVILVRRLCGSVCVERGCVAAVDGAVRIDTAEITPVVEEVQN
jgi:hypothetical protein